MRLSISASSDGEARRLNLHEFIILGNSVGTDLVMVEARLGRTNAILLAHLEILAEGLVTTPPIQVDHADALVALRLVEVRVTHVVFDSVCGEATVICQLPVVSVHLTASPPPVLNHTLFLVLANNVGEERRVEVEGDERIHKSESVLLVEGLHFPV